MAGVSHRRCPVRAFLARSLKNAAPTRGRRTFLVDASVFRHGVARHRRGIAPRTPSRAPTSYVVLLAFAAALQHTYPSRPRRGFAAAISKPGLPFRPPIAHPGDNESQDITSASCSATVANHRPGTFIRACLSAGSCSPAGIRRCGQPPAPCIHGRTAPWMYCFRTSLVRSCLYAPTTTRQDMIGASNRCGDGTPARDSTSHPLGPTFCSPAGIRRDVRNSVFNAAAAPIRCGHFSGYHVRPGPGRNRYGGGAALTEQGEDLPCSAVARPAGPVPAHPGADYLYQGPCQARRKQDFHLNSMI